MELFSLILIVSVENVAEDQGGLLPMTSNKRFYLSVIKKLTTANIQWTVLMAL